MEQLKTIKQCLVSAVQTQLGDLKKTDAKELGEVIDMIKDLEEAIYYCSITEAMEKAEDEKHSDTNKMYYGERRQVGPHYYVPYMEYAPYMMRNDKMRGERFGDWLDRASQSRRMYMEGKVGHKNEQQSMKELEHYIKDLGEDLTDMVRESSMEERQILSNKLQQLATKIDSDK